MQTPLDNALIFQSATQSMIQAKDVFVKSDNLDGKKDAILMYSQGIEQLNTCLKNERDPMKVSQLKMYMDSCMNEAEQMKKVYLDFKATQLVKSTQELKPANGKSAAKPKDEEPEPQKQVKRPTLEEMMPSTGMPSMKFDNSKLRDQVSYALTAGKKKFYESDTIEGKREGLKMYTQGVGQLNLWIQREDGTIKAELNRKLDACIEEQATMKEAFDDLQAGETVSMDTGGQAYKPKPSGGDKKGKKGGGGKDDDDKEKQKMKETLGEAIVTEKPNVKWTDIAGLENAKKALQEAVILPIRFPQLFGGARTPWKGILLFGPPGTGKTYLAKACATETEGTFISVSSADLISKYVGESEKMIKTLFQVAREKKPCIIFIDEIDSLCSARSDNENEASRRVKTEFLVQMQGVGNDSDGILILGATNIPWGLDTAIRRRFEKRIYIPLPEMEARRLLLINLMKNTPHKLIEKDFEEIAKKTDGYSGSDLSVLVRDAVYEPVRKCQNANHFLRFYDNGKEMFMPVLPADVSKVTDKMNLKQMVLTDITGDQLRVPDVTVDDFRLAVTKSKKSVAKDQLLEYENWTKEFGQDG